MPPERSTVAFAAPGDSGSGGWWERTRSGGGARRRSSRSAAPRPGLGPPARGNPGQGGPGRGNGQVGGSKVGRNCRGATLVKAAAVVVVLGVITVGPGPGRRAVGRAPRLQKFLLAWEGGQYKTAARDDHRPALTAVAAALRGAYEQLDAANLELQMGHIRQATVPRPRPGFRASVDLGSGGLRWGLLGQLRDAPDYCRLGGCCGTPRSSCPACGPATGLAVLASMPSRAQVQNSAGRVADPGPHRECSSSACIPTGWPGPQADGGSGWPTRSAWTRPRSTGRSSRRPSTTFLGLLRLRARPHTPGWRNKLARVARPDYPAAETSDFFDSIAPAVNRGGRHREPPTCCARTGCPYRPGCHGRAVRPLRPAYQRTLDRFPDH